MELSETINSMYKWYLTAKPYYIYLSDIGAGGDANSTIGRWFARGWTLQELLAPTYIIFNDNNWDELGTKWSLRKIITTATNFSESHLGNPLEACMAVKMSWVLPEDRAYSLGPSCCKQAPHILCSRGSSLSKTSI